jgi:pimeloyl-ACP methyl ester carboxylesterase
MEPKIGKTYPPHLTAGDTVLQDTFAKIGELRKDRDSYTPDEFCKKFWSILSVIYVANAIDAEKIHWARCDVPNELNFMKYWTDAIIPSIQNLDLKPEDLAKVNVQVLTIHGTKDRSSPYGGGREWDFLLPNARLVTVENAGHAPWIENPKLVFESIKTFLDGRWPEKAETVKAIDPKNNQKIK